MSKAYDSVHLPLLAKALQRIKVPNTIINLLNNILTQKQNNVITNHGNTNYYHVQDGIDQGETITPLLWRIYYDPLITKINKNPKSFLQLFLLILFTKIGKNKNLTES